LNELCTVPDTSRRLKVGQTSVRELIKEGKLTAITVKGRLRVPSSAIDRFIQDRISEATRPIEA